MRPTAASEQNHPAPASDIAALVLQAAQGDEIAWESIVRLYGRRIYALAKSRLRDADAAEEITQSVFATLASKLRNGEDSHYHEVGKFEPWLFRIVMNRIRDEGRRRQRRGTKQLEFADSDSVRGFVAESQDADTEAESQRELRALRNAMQNLGDRDREIIELRHHGSLSFAQIAELLGEPIGTVLARHHRALNKLKQRLVSKTKAAVINGSPAKHAGGNSHA